MLNFRAFRAAFALALAGLAVAHAAPAAAQSTRSWISGVGDDANPCSRTAPCKTFQGALPKTAAGGEINCLDPGGFGSVTITKSISIICDNTEAGVLVAATNAIIINSATAVVVISGLDIEGLGQTGVAGVNGIYILNAATVHVRNTQLRGFRNGYGINFAPQSGSSQLIVDDVRISEGGSGAVAASGGILIQPPVVAGSSRVTLNDVQLVNNIGAGVRIDTSGTPAGSSVVMDLSNSSVSQNAQGVVVVTPPSTATTDVTVTNTEITNNTGFGLIGNGATARVRVGSSTIAGNGTGVLVAGGSVVNSYGNNILGGNTTNGAFTLPTIPLN